MRLKSCILMVLSLLLLAATASGKNFLIRPYGLFGGAATNSDIPYNATWSATSPHKDPITSYFSYGGGVQVFYALKGTTTESYFALGLDLGYLHAWDWSVTTNGKLFKYSYDYINCNVLLEVKYELTGIGFLFYAGPGIYLNASSPTATNPDLYQLLEPAKDPVNGTFWGLQVATGISIALSKNIKIPLILRGDLIFADKFVYPSAYYPNVLNGTYGVLSGLFGIEIAI